MMMPVLKKKKKKNLKGDFKVQFFENYTVIVKMVFVVYGVQSIGA